MGFVSLTTRQFRNLHDSEVTTDGNRVFFVGENGQGKTNLLESIYLLCYGSSFRTRRDTDLCRIGYQSFLVSGVTRSPGSQNDFLSKCEVRYSDRKKEIQIDGKAIVDRKELLDLTPCIVFCHDDILFVSGPPDSQRTFFNQTSSLTRPLFVDTLRRYTKILKTRNSILKEEKKELLDVLDEQIIAPGRELVFYRTAMVEDFNAVFARIFSRVSGIPDQLSIRYQPSWTVDNELEDLQRNHRKDLYLKSTTVGPHRDRFTFEMNGSDFLRVASTGQIRLISLILKVAQATYVHSETSRNPIMLLDDVLLELDPVRRSRFMESLPTAEQSFFTFLPDEQYATYVDGETLVYDVADGIAQKRV